jgi:hypothetical protein
MVPVGSRRSLPAVVQVQPQLHRQGQHFEYQASRNVHVQNTYVNVVNVTNITYVNQSRGATAMRHEDFASGRDARIRLFA